MQQIVPKDSTGHVSYLLGEAKQQVCVCMFTCTQLKPLRMLVINVIALVTMAGEVKGQCSVTGTEAVAWQ